MGTQQGHLAIPGPEQGTTKAGWERQKNGGRRHLQSVALNRLVWPGGRGHQPKRRCQSGNSRCPRGHGRRDGEEPPDRQSSSQSHEKKHIAPPHPLSTARRFRHGQIWRHNNIFHVMRKNTRRRP
ncbi:hypothetical protein DQ04_12001000 [Trypanosoma grayi]|uniref:hypothetical protein n=1 Tax=Trypanosoma grayi TaxID=71804 RepID=UPI0004F4B93A|nr:hypothetical protein DQ04_12001000 [Trypanosoma grayi]KEG06835.1 hypothetical protein DQ04_12001000 [Trypanosoma grayi]